MEKLGNIKMREDYLKEGVTPTTDNTSGEIISRDQFLLDENLIQKFKVKHKVEYFDRSKVKVGSIQEIVKDFVKKYEDFK